MKPATLMSVCVLVGLFIGPGSAGAQSQTGFDPLLGHLPAASDLVVLADLREAGSTLEALLDKVEKTALVAENQELKQMFTMQRSMLLAGLAAVKVNLGLDPMKDLKQAVIGVVFRKDSPPRMVVVITGKIPEDLIVKMDLGSPKKVEGRDVFRLEPDLFIAQLPGKLILADQESMPLALTGGEIPGSLIGRHSGLRDSPGGGILLRFSLDLPDFVRALVTSDAGRMFRTLVTGLRRIEFAVGDRLALHMVCSNAEGAERARLVLDGWSEVIMGGAHMWRAYAMLLLGFDIGAVEGLPPQVAAAFANRPALLKTLDEFFPVPDKAPEVSTGPDHRVSLTAPAGMLQGATFVLGTLSAVAIPAFIGYTRKSKQAGIQAQLMSLRTALEMYQLEKGGYPSTQQGLRALVEAGMLEGVPVDAWGRKFEYSSASTGTYSLKSLGADGQEGGEGQDTDVVISP